MPLPARRVKDKRLRGRWFARPRVAFVALEPSWGISAGLVAGHQWWSLRESTLRPVGETQLTVGFPIGALSGHDLSLVSTAGAWLGPVGLLAGPMIRHDRLQTGSSGLSSAFSAGPSLRMAARVGSMTPYLSATPTWILEGREGLDAPWDELELGAGLELGGKPISWRLGSSWRDTSAGDRWEAVVGLHWRLL